MDSSNSFAADCAEPTFGAVFGEGQCRGHFARGKKSVRCQVHVAIVRCRLSKCLFGGVLAAEHFEFPAAKLLLETLLDCGRLRHESGELSKSKSSGIAPTHG